MIDQSEEEVFIWTRLNFLYPWVLCVKLGWNFDHGSGEEEWYKSSIHFNIKVWFYIRKKIKFTLPKDALYQVAVKLALWFLEKKFCMLSGRLELRILMSNKLGYMKFWRFFNKWKWWLHRQWTLVHQKAFSVQRFLQSRVTVGVAYFKRTLTAQWP